MNHYPRFTSRVVPLLTDNVDTDQIIPARFLKITSRDGLGEHLFSDWRYNADGSSKPDFVLHQPFAKSASILLAGDNFGCGSSREHAPWALTGFGFRAIISTSFADIFKSNALKNGLLPIALDTLSYQRILLAVRQNAAVELTIDLEKQTIELPDGPAIQFSIDSFARVCLLNGTDELGYLLKCEKAIAAFELLHST